jgi:molybdopterin-binding protein
VFKGKVVHVCEGPLYDLVTVEIAPEVELTVTLARLPVVGERGAPAPIKAGDTITIAVPPPSAIHDDAWGGRSQ